jgi:ribosomal-protein-alanine N-acetyltransferase
MAYVKITLVHWLTPSWAWFKLRDSSSVTLRRLRRDDIDEVVEIEKEAFSPLWVSSGFKRDIDNRYASYLVACLDEITAVDGARGELATEPVGSELSLWSRLAGRIGLGAAADRTTAPTSEEYEIAGYVSVWYQGEEAHITEIAVRQILRGRGIGELLLIGSLRAAIEYGSKVMTLEARVSNFIAQRLYQKYNFKSAGIRKGYYSDNREDAVIMTTTPINTEEYARMFDELQDAYEARRGEIAFEGDI